MLYIFLHTGLVPLYRYWKPWDHFYTTNIKEIGNANPGSVGNSGYTSEGIQCLIYSKQVKGTVPLYRYWSPFATDHFYTTNAGEIGTTTPGQRGKGSYKSEGITGYCFPTAVPGTIPLYRYCRGVGAGTDHFYTTNTQEIGTTTPGQVGKHSYAYEGITCHVLPYYG